MQSYKKKHAETTIIVNREKITTESTNVMPAPADRSDSWKVYKENNGTT
jgi:hypothetical protein